MGSSGGGGSSGAVSHSAYLETIHNNWLDNTGTDLLTLSITDVMESSIGNSPWTGLTAYDPDADILEYKNSIAAYAVILAGLSDTVDWSTLYTHADSIFNALGPAVTAYSDLLDDNINVKVLPKFRRGMQDINAVVSSAFVIGESNIWGFRDRDVAGYVASLEDKKLNAVDQMIQMMARRIGWQESYVRTMIEANRIKIVAKKEQTDRDSELDEHDAKWDLEVFQYGGNLMAAIGGGTVVPNMAGKNKTASMLGGALTGGVAAGMLSGTAAGAAMGIPAGPAGVIGGAVLGAAMGLFS